MRHDTTEVLRPFQLSVPRHEVLGNLYFSRRGEITLGRLSELIMTHPTSLTGIVDGLERMKLVERVAHPTDRRTTLVRITGEGRQIYEKSAKLIVDTTMSIDALTDDEADLVYRLLSKVISAGGVKRGGNGARGNGDPGTGNSAAGRSERLNKPQRPRAAGR
jgi:DNA-binding MarR family transcriptional regulator